MQYSCEKKWREVGIRKVEKETKRPECLMYQAKLRSSRDSNQMDCVQGSVITKLPKVANPLS